MGLVLALMLLGELEWEAPLHCPSRDEALEAIGYYLGREVSADDPRTSVVVTEQRGGYRLELHTRDGSHVVEGVDCGRLTQVAASVAAIAIDPLAMPPVVEESVLERTSEASEPIAGVGPSETGASEPIAMPEPPIELPPARIEQPNPWGPLEAVGAEDLPIDAPERNRSKQPRGLVYAAADLGLAVFPRVAPGVDGGFGFDRGALHVELGASGWFAGRFRSDTGAVGGDLSAWQVTVRPCGAPRWTRVELRVCGAFGAGQVRGRGVGVSDSQLLAQPWVALGGDLGLAVVVHPNLALVVDVGASGNLLRARFWTEAPDAQYLMPALSGRGRVGFEVRFP